MSHRDTVVAPPDGATTTATSKGTPVAAFEDPARRVYGVQFHPEVLHTPHGTDLLKNFLYDVAEAPPAWTPAAVIEQQVERIREQVGDERIICGLSGGVDSAVAALLVHKAVGDQLTCVFVDHGLHAEGRGRAGRGDLRRPLPRAARPRAGAGALPHAARGRDRPERPSARSSARSSSASSRTRPRELGAVKHLVQGTLYSDVIESGGDRTGAAEAIKSHHNVGGLPADMTMELVEPLRLLFKDEVRRVGDELGLPERMVWRHPFPGPGLAIRIIGDVTEERLSLLREADSILLEEVRRAGLYRELWQCFAVLPAIRSVGVQGDSRTYAYPIVIRAVSSEDAMTADWARLPYDLVELVSSRIINELPGVVNRVVARHLLEAAGHHRVGMRAAAPRRWGGACPGGRGSRRAATQTIRVTSEDDLDGSTHDQRPEGREQGRYRRPSTTCSYNTVSQFGHKEGLPRVGSDTGNDHLHESAHRAVFPGDGHAPRAARSPSRAPLLSSTKAGVPR